MSVSCAGTWTATSTAGGSADEGTRHRHDGYIGYSLVPILRSAGHDVVGLDAYLFHDG
jgi:hypothetical protein